MADVEVEDADAPEAEQVEEEAASLFFSVQGVFKPSSIPDEALSRSIS